MHRPLLYMNKRGPFSVFLQKVAGSGKALMKAIGTSAGGTLTTAGGTTVSPAVITLSGTFTGTETLNFTSVTDGQPVPINESLSCPPGSAEVVAAYLASIISEAERSWSANGATLECLALAPSTTVTLSAVSLT